jgi:protein O-GlcNAc transferase
MDIPYRTELAIRHYQRGDLQTSECIFKEILLIQPDNIDALSYLGLISYQCLNYDNAIEYIQKIIEIAPDEPMRFFVYHILGDSFLKKGKTDNAVINYKKALEINPDSAEVYYSLGNIFRNKRDFNNAIACYQKVTEIEPHNSLVYNQLAVIFKDMGKLNDAENCLKHAIEKDPSCHVYYTNLLFLRNYNLQHDAKSIYYAHIQFAERYADHLSTSIIRHLNRPIVNRRLRIGYVSPDFKFHSVAFFIEPVLTEHNRESFEIFCYSDWPFPDQVTRRIQKHVEHWRDIVGMPDKDVHDLIRKDEIDILVDLAGHASNIRMLLFARKPAPIQVSWIGYPATTGLRTVDYKIVDNYTDPLGMTEQFYTEKLIRMPHSFLCYLPEKDSPEVSPLPALSALNITFGSFNAFAKLSPDVFRLWTSILQATPNSRLVIKTQNFSDNKLCDYVFDTFTKKGIDQNRITLLSWAPSTREHLKTYSKVDIGLDTYPYNGTTTTFEAMWMGVPVVTLAGNTHISRVGASILSNIGLQELVANTNKEYVDIAVNLSNDLERLQSLRERLRDIMKHSSLCDAKRFTANLEMCYRNIWEKWCKSD